MTQKHLFVIYQVARDNITSTFVINLEYWLNSCRPWVLQNDLLINQSINQTHMSPTTEHELSLIISHTSVHLVIRAASVFIHQSDRDADRWVVAALGID